jgi:hypothetical protein
VLLLVLSVALITLLASYVYLARGWVRPEPLDGTEVLFALGAAAAAAGSGLALRAAVAARDVVLRARRRTALGLAALGAVTSLLLWWLLYGYHETRFTRTTDAEGAMFFAFMVFQLIVTLLVAIVAGVANAWAWRAPADPRGNAPASNGALIAFFLAASWIVLFATLTFVPRFMQM